VTSQKEHLQTLIAEIDVVLQRTSPRLPWVMSGEVAQQRQVLEKVRNYLVALQQNPTLGLGQPPGNTTPPGSMYGTIAGMPADLSPYQMLQTIMQEVSYLRSNLAQSGMPQPPNQPQLTAELLQVLMSRLQEDLSKQIAQALENLRQQPSPYDGSAMSSGMPATIMPQYEQLQALRSRSDQMLVNLDSTLNLVFESLQRNIQAYQESLSQGVERMYNMGQQSEYTFKALIDQLAQQLKQEASAYLLASQTAPPAADSLVTIPTQAKRSPTSSPSAPVAPPVPPTTAAFPYAGVELPSLTPTPPASTPPAPPVETSNTQTETPLDSAIESWLQAVSAMNRDAVPTLVEPESSALPQLDLSELDLGGIDVDVPSVNPRLEVNRPSLSVPAVVQPPLSTSESSPTVSLPSTEPDTAEIDAALKLLEEISAELDAVDAPSVAAAEAELAQLLSATETDETGGTSLPDDARDELDEFYQDEFYQSLFGTSETSLEPTPEVVTEPSIAPPAKPTESPLPTETASHELTLSEEQVPEPIFFPDETFGAIEPRDESEGDLPSLSLELPDDLFDLEQPLQPSSATISSQSVEAIAPAASEASPGLESDDITDLLQGVPETATRSTPVEPPSTRQTPARPAIAPVQQPQELVLSDDLFWEGSPIEVNEDQFARADENEVLLPTEGETQPGVTLELDDLTLSSLSEDLSGLESYFNPDIFSTSQPPASLPLESSTIAPSELPAPEPTLTPPTPAPAESTAITSTPVTIAKSADEGTRPSAAGAKPFYEASAAIAASPTHELSGIFGDPSSVPPIAAIPTTEPLPFTLEGTNDLFESAVEAPPAVPAPSNLNEPSPFTLEGMDDLFEAGSASIQTSAPSTPVVPPAERSSYQEIPPFKPELYVPPDNGTEPTPPFQLEGLDNLFADPNITDVPSEHSTPATNGSAAPPIPDKRSLDAALESLLGTPPTSTTEPPIQPPPQKKKIH